MDDVRKRDSKAHVRTETHYARSTECRDGIIEGRADEDGLSRYSEIGELHCSSRDAPIREAYTICEV